MSDAPSRPYRHASTYGMPDHVALRACQNVTDAIKELLVKLRR